MVEIIAEIGVNHDGSLDKAIQLADAAIEAGADTVKTQYYITENLCAPNHPQFDMLKARELNFLEMAALQKHVRAKNRKFLVSVFCLETLEHMETIQQDRYKVASGEVTHTPLIEALVATNKPLIISDGMVDDDDEAVADVNEMINWMTTSWLHCVSAYPARYDELNLMSVDGMEGLSDHTIGPECAIAAVALGAEIIEKHFTLNRNHDGPDHHMSMEPRDFKQMVEMIRNVEQALQPAPVNTALKPYVMRTYSPIDGKWLRRMPCDD